MPGLIYICSDSSSASEQLAGADSVPVCATGVGEWVEVESLFQGSSSWSLQVSQSDFVDLLAATLLTFSVAWGIKQVLNVIRSRS